MYQTIYFRKDIWENLKDEKKKSELINNLLDDWYSGKIGNPLPQNQKPTAEFVPIIIDTIEQTEEAVKQLKQGKKVEVPTCPNGHILQSGRDKCSTKGCKYAV